MLLSLDCERLKPELKKFTKTGETSIEFLAHLNCCESCKKAVDEEFARQAGAIEELARYLRKQDGH